MKLRNPRSFIEPRAKSSFNIRDILLLSVVFLAIAIVLFFWFKPSSKPSENTKNITSKELLTKEEILSKTLPNHKRINLTIQKELTNLLSVVPYDMVLNALNIKDGNSTIEGEIIYKDSYYKEIKPKLLKLYKTSSAKMYKTSEGTYNINVSNKIVKKVYLPRLMQQTYNIGDIKPMKELENSIKLMLPKNSIVRFTKEEKAEKYSKTSFKVSTYIKSPQELYNIIERMNNKNSCIVIQNNIELTTYGSMIRINFIVSIYQINSTNKNP